MRKSCDAAFKVRRATEAVKKQMTRREMAREYEVHLVQVSHWRKQLFGVQR